MKKLILITLSLLFVFSGCAPAPADLSNLSETYTTVVSMPYRQVIGKDIKTPKKEMGNITFDEVKGYYISDKTIMEFTPYFAADDKDIIRIVGFETVKKVDESIVSYIRGIQNVIMSYYGNVKIDPEITKRVTAINDISMCKDGESYKEAWEFEGFPLEYMVDFKDGNAYIKIQYDRSL